MDVVGILLAAGRGIRFDPSAQRLKLLEPGFEPLLEPVSATAAGATGPRQPIAAIAARTLRAELDRVFAVVRADAGANQQRLRRLLAAQGCTVLACPARAPAGGSVPASAQSLRAEGMGTSIACAVAACPEAGGWIVALADMPRVRPETVAAIRCAIAAGAASAAPFYRGRRGHPVGFGAVCRAELGALSGDSGARSVLARHPPVRIEVDDPGVLLDVDVPADLAMLQRTAGVDIP